ncbi:2-oxoglutarate dehydrogenase E1 component [Virgibacillus dakarensis]|uniref:2-oxoglutarate dehydrogenase E1 component n=1 Tax=Lentibacillus populi TaxID=1827502 RepID=A0A9W5X7E5_9BACI|nr:MULTISPECIES: 2-oxoglutarate dehydrogenase E1 component [Bacillaceae]MTW86995.1 2-oxoglutarate dehydrogenase E1 component [Virgibacillus dakarensis]GGB55836.1 2-oxoglutarate dehydrogenase E1 component [Lentibacillus populi]
MAQNEESSERFWGKFYGPNMGYIEEQYDLYKEDPEAIDSSLRELFEQHGAPNWTHYTNGAAETSAASPSISDVKKLTSAMKLVEAIRRYGHLEADIYPVGRDKNRKSDIVNPKTYGLSEEDLKNIPASWLWEEAPTGVDNGFEVMEQLKKYYCGTITFEYDHVNNDDERKWLLERIESGKYQLSLSDEEKKHLLERLAHVEGFEGFLQKTFVGQKRFSIEGLEVMIPMLDQIVKHATSDKIEHIMMGMAHRGRLSVLSHILGKPYDKIFSEFHHSPDKELIPSEGSTGINYGWTGDVKYHFGATTEVKDSEEMSTHITLAHNPSHLEFVNPVVQGFTRAAQDTRSEKGYPKQDVNKAFNVLIHGDAAFIGEGVVAESLNLSGLPGYHTGGTLHLIANNLVGYTTDQRDGRSTRYASDLAKGYEIPIIHVNADDPIACVSAMNLAYEYRKEFHKDFLIDLVGYRRYGHNEMDEPRTTQPQLYQDIDKHPTVAQVFTDVLTRDGIIEEGSLAKIKDQVESSLRDIFDSMRENDTGEAEAKCMPKALTNDIDQFDTAVPLEQLKALNKGLLKRPEGFTGFKKLEKILKRRENVLEEGNKADWGAGEALTYASILQDGIPVRLTGQDSERGTFAHRHIVLHDVKKQDSYCLMHGLDEAKASFDIRNSPLSEAGVLGYEYGYSVQSPNTLVLWEAQFGDFANAAQVIFDQFISAARAKWGEKSNMVILLPHGYEGQGPEHSSARLERYLQLAAENNIIVANVTSSAQFFHLIRRQAAMRGREEARPLILMTPKSLLRNQRVASSAEEFSEGRFQALRSQPNLKVSKEDAKRLLIGSGKVMVDIEEALDKSEESFDWLRVLRLEQIYPFPEEELAKELAEMPNVEEIVWVQEEPKNMGAWDFVDDYLRDLLKDGQTLRYIGRPDRAAPAVGEPNVHKTEQNQIVREAINESIGGDSSERN